MKHIWEQLFNLSHSMPDLVNARLLSIDYAQAVASVGL